MLKSLRCSSKVQSIVLTAGVVGVALATGLGAQAQMSLTAAGVGQGLTLSTFVSSIPNNGQVGPVDEEFLPGGKVLVSDYGDGNTLVFATDTDGQLASSGTVGQYYGNNNPAGLAQLGGKVYMTLQGSASVVQINNDGTFNQSIVGGLSSATGLVADPHTGRLYVSTPGFGNIYEVDPIAKTTSLFVNANADGLTLSADGKTLYAAVNGFIEGFDTTTKAQVFTSSYIGGLDGTALGAGAFSGLIFANTNYGTLYEVNLNTLVQTEIASGGSRGDIVHVDPNNDTLLLTQTDSILRLSGASFQNSGVPEPGVSAMIAGLAVSGLTVLRRKRRR